MKRSLGFVFLCILTVMSGLRCSRLGSIAGNSSSETTNGITVAVFKSDGSPAAGALVRLRRGDYVTTPTAFAKSMITGAEATTDEHGRFEINSIEPGAYCIEVRDPATGAGQGGAVLFRCSIAADDTVNLGTDTLRPYAAICGTVDISGISGKRLFVQVVGLERLVPVDSTGGFSLNDLPAGLFSLRIIASEGPQTTLIRTDQASAVSGDTVNTTMPGWGYSKKVFINTAPLGANVIGNVYGFPLLIRLNVVNFDFLQARDSGQDVRFTAKNGTTLACQIEQWDSAARQAAIWVKVDTIFGNDDRQYIIMYWGNRSAPDRPAGNAVFDTAQGFAGVWHLNERGTGLAGEYADVTQNANNGTGGGNKGSAPSIADGVAGGAQAFDSSYIDVPDNPSIEPPQDMSVQAWIRLDAVPLTGNQDFFIVDKMQSQAYFFRVFHDVATVQFVWSNTDQVVGDAIGGTSLTPGVWHHVAAVKQDTVIKIYINGHDDTFYRSPAYGTLFNSSSSLMLGSFYWRGDKGGMIDEVQLSNVARSADWIRLSFENQRLDGTLVTLSP